MNKIEDFLSTCKSESTKLTYGSHLNKFFKTINAEPNTYFNTTKTRKAYEKDVDLLEYLFDLYGKRWGIETSYRVKKHAYRPKTTSKNYYIRSLSENSIFSECFALKWHFTSKKP